MPIEPPDPRYLSQHTRRALVANACRDRDSTAYEVAKRLETDERPISRMLKSLHTKGVVHCHEGKRGRTYRLNPSWGAAVEIALPPRVPLNPGDSLLLVGSQQLARFWTMIGRGELGSEFTGILEFQDSALGAALLFGPETREDAVDRVFLALQQAQVSTQRIRLGRTVLASEARRRAVELMGPPDPALGS